MRRMAKEVVSGEEGRTARRRVREIRRAEAQRARRRVREEASSEKSRGDLERVRRRGEEFSKEWKPGKVTSEESTLHSLLPFPQTLRYRGIFTAL